MDNDPNLHTDFAFQSIADRIPGGLCLLRQDPDGDMSLPWCSARIVELCGVDKETLKADSNAFFCCVHPDDRDRIKTEIAESAKCLNMIRSEWRHRLPSGEYHWFRMDSMPRLEKDGSVMCYGYMADIQDLKMGEEQIQHTLAELKHLATMDHLTNVFNRRHFFAVAHTEVIRAQRYCRPLSIMMLDVDYFKSVNDTVGHVLADIVLKQAAQIIANNIRISDVLARYGGEEFIILLPETDSESAFVIANRIRQNIERFPFLEDTKSMLSLTISIGIASVDDDSPVGHDLDSLIHYADKALYAAKGNGRNQVMIHGRYAAKPPQ